jgi:hypothetical protein
MFLQTSSGRHEIYRNLDHIDAIDIAMVEAHTSGW